VAFFIYEKINVYSLPKEKPKPIMIRLLFFACFVIGTITTNAQQIIAQIVDSQTHQSVPFATIKIADTELISNDHGYFTFSQEKVADSDLILVSSIGYLQKNIYLSDLKSSNNIIYIVPVIYEFDEVLVSNEIIDPYEIMKIVRDSLAKNYTTESYKNTFFSRSAFTFVPKKLSVEVKKSTATSKENLAQANREIEQIADQIINEKMMFYDDKWFDLYKITQDKKSNYKLGMQKHVLLQDENKTSGFGKIEESSMDVFLKLLDTTKFYRVKSGLFGSRKDTISFSKEYNNNKKQRGVKISVGDDKQEDTISKSVLLRENIISTLRRNSITKGAMLDFVYNIDNYDYTYVEATYLGNDLVFVIDFKPKKKSGKFQGKLYINESDYAILRVDYKLVEGRKIQGINLKFLLGVKFARNHCIGTIIFKKNKHSDSYGFHYFSQEIGDYFYINRPIKFIELVKKDKDVVAFELKIEADNITKTEFLNIDSQQISTTTFDAFIEPNFSTEYLKKYDPTIWEDYHIIEPLEEMKKFEVAE